MKNIQNQYLEQRLNGVYDNLISSFEAGNRMSSASKGLERELFIKGFLKQVFPPQYRFESGDITDIQENRTGQLDIVIESPFLYSLPLVNQGPRLYFSEGVASVIEVKSNLKNQWSEVLETANKVKDIKRSFKREYLLRQIESIRRIAASIPATSPNEGLMLHIESLQREIKTIPEIRNDIPIYAIGYKGWKSLDTIKTKLKGSNLDGIVNLNPLNAVFRDFPSKGPRTPALIGYQGLDAIWRLLDGIVLDVQQTNEQILPTWNYRLRNRNEEK